MISVSDHKLCGEWLFLRDQFQTNQILINQIKMLTASNRMENFGKIPRQTKLLPSAVSPIWKLKRKNAPVVKNMDTQILKPTEMTGFPWDGMPPDQEKSISEYSMETLELQLEEVTRLTSEQMMTLLFADTILWTLTFQSSTNSLTSPTLQSATPLRL